MVIVLSLNVEVLCKRDVRSQNRDETETLEWRYRDKSDTFEKTPRDRLETETFETETTTLSTESGLYRMEKHEGDTASQEMLK